MNDLQTIENKAKCLDLLLEVFTAIEPHANNRKPEIDALLDAVVNIKNLKSQRDALSAENESLKSLLREAVTEEPKTECADNGTKCAFCFKEYRSEWPTKGFHVIHADDCWLVRAHRLTMKTD